MVDRRTALRRLTQSEIEQVLSQDRVPKSETDASFAEFAKEVKHKLGYATLTQLVEADEDKTQESVEQVRLLRELAELGIRPLDSESVKHYQAAKANNLPRYALIGVSLMIAGVNAIAFLVNVLFRGHSWLNELLSFGIVAIVATGLWAFAYRFIPNLEWQTIGLEQFGTHRQSQRKRNGTKPTLLPRETLEFALRIKDAIPDASFRVYELKAHYAEFPDLSRVLDPFLAVTRGMEEYVIAVWDEPGFNQKLLIID